MVFHMHFVAICLLISQGYGMHSYQSILNTEGRPILRSEMDKIQAASPSEDSGWLEKLRASIEHLVARHGYDAAKPHIKKAVAAVEKEKGVLLDVKVSRNGDSRTSYEYKDTVRLRSILREGLRAGDSRTSYEYKDTARLRSILREGLRADAEEEWVTDLKAYVKKLISHYGKKSLDFHLRPIIESLEGKHDVLITDIDGDISVKYEKSKTMKKNKKENPEHYVNIFSFLRR